MTVETAKLETRDVIARRITITGVVQGVGFRPFVFNLAEELGLSGWVLNHSGGVDIEVEGPEADVASFIADLSAKAPPLAQIVSLEADVSTPRGHKRFEIRRSESVIGRYQLISPDVATCPDCLQELFDPKDRRYRYPFTNCTNCGPRFTIIEDIPYDRPHTTMRVFPMCGACQAEYDNPRDRRFHAQPNACPRCGPEIWLLEAATLSRSLAPGEAGPADPPVTATAQPPNTSPTGEAALARVRDLLREGKILAIKGLGGFHLACDATNANAVRVLRARKKRPHKPLAIMVPGIDEVKALCKVSPMAERTLTSPQCPIVLLEADPDSPIAPNVAPNSHLLGVMLPYTPLHHVLLRDAGRPLVMTSGNSSEEPIAKDNAEALQRLGSLADAFLLHDRDIHARYDDSVVQLIADRDGQDSLPPTSERGSSRIQPVRRARGYAPAPIQLPFAVPQILATGPLLKNTFTLTRDSYAFVSQHIGDLETLETLEHYQAALETYRSLFRVEPEAVASDLHPDYLSTRIADAFAREHGLPEPYRIQHHQAHIAACLAENAWFPDRGPVIGIAFDGTGYGDDGHIWGGEWFVGNYASFKRVAHLEYLPLPGGDAAIRNPWRTAVAYLHALGLDEALPLGEFCPADVMRIRRMVDRGLNSPLNSSMGRLFDAVSALLRVCHTTTYEAQAAIELEQLVAPRASVDPATAAYPFAIDSADSPYQVQVGPLFEALLSDIGQMLPHNEISLRFHATVAAMIDDVSRRIRDATGINTVALSGGVFQNRLLLALLRPQLRRAGFELLQHGAVPPNDGGVSLGQAVMAGFAIENRTEG